jgi:hypothetical protein
LSIWNKLLTISENVRQIAIVREDNSIRRVDVKRLRLGHRRASGSRVAHMTDAHIAQQPRHIVCFEDIREQAIPLLEVKPAIKVRRNARGILAAMLKHRKAFIENRADRAMTEDADYTAHGASLPGCCQSAWCVTNSTGGKKLGLPVSFRTVGFQFSV